MNAQGRQHPTTNLQKSFKFQEPNKHPCDRCGERLSLEYAVWVRLLLSASLLLALAFSGCTTRANARARERAAFVAGQQQAMERILQSRSSVTVVGPVRNPLIPWTEDLTLAKALVAAGYYTKGDPKEIIIVRNGQSMTMDPRRLLAGEDVPLEAGDVVNVR